MPALPTCLRAIPAGDGRIALDWVGADAGRFQVYRDGRLIANGPIRSEYVDEGLENGRAYEYRVSAGDGAAISAWTEPASGTAAAPAPITDGRSAIPAGLQVDATAAGAVALDWVDNADAGDLYQVYRDGQRIESALADSSYVDTTAVAGQAYEYRVSAGTAEPYGDWTEPVEVTVTAAGAAAQAECAEPPVAEAAAPAAADGTTAAPAAAAETSSPATTTTTTTTTPKTTTTTAPKTTTTTPKTTTTTPAATTTPSTSKTTTAVAPARTTTTTTATTSGSAPATTGGSGDVLWSADFESNNLSSVFKSFENRSAPLPSLVANAAGGKAGSFVAPPASFRNEVIPSLTLSNGQTRYFGWDLMLPANLTTESAWRVLAQWRHNGRSGSPPISLKLENGSYKIDGGWIDSGSDVGEPSDLNTHPLGSASADKGKYVRWVFGIHFAVGSPYKGWVSVWKNGTQIANQVAWKTMYRDQGGNPFTSSLKFGIYRDSSIKTTDVINHDNWKMGTTYASVAR